MTPGRPYWQYFYQGDSEILDVAEMHDKFGITLNTFPTHLPKDESLGRARFLQEEVTEFVDALEADDFEKMIDALVDIVVVAKGTAVMMGLQWNLHWDEVRRANMEKIRSPENRYGTVPQLEKPPGWKEPNHKAALEKYR